MIIEFKETLLHSPAGDFLHISPVTNTAFPRHPNYGFRSLSRNLHSEYMWNYLIRHKNFSERTTLKGGNSF